MLHFTSGNCAHSSFTHFSKPCSLFTLWKREHRNQSRIQQFLKAEYGAEIKTAYWCTGAPTGFVRINTSSWIWGAFSQVTWSILTLTLRILRKTLGWNIHSSSIEVTLSPAKVTVARKWQLQEERKWFNKVWWRHKDSHNGCKTYSAMSLADISHHKPQNLTQQG